MADLQDLYLQNNQISSIQDGGLAGLTNLRRLELSGNQLTDVDRRDFAGLTKLQHLELWGNEITSIESGTFAELADLQNLFMYDNQLANIESDDFVGLSNLKKLNLSGNRIESIESGAFAGMTRLERLNLLGNPIQELNFTSATFENLTSCRSVLGFCVQTPATTSVVLDDASVSRNSFDVIVDETDSVTEYSLVGLRFTQEKPTNLAGLLDIASLDKVTVDQSLFQQYVDEFRAFEAIGDNSLLVVPGLCDINRNGACDLDDVNAMAMMVMADIRTEAEYTALIQRQSPDGFNTFFGDVNLDGEFNSSDLVKVFATAEYEDSIENNSTWEEGDWDLDGDFTTSDLVVAFQDGGYENGPRPGSTAVPEPAGSALLAVATIIVVRRKTLRFRFDNYRFRFRGPAVY